MRPANSTCPNCGAPLTMDSTHGTAHCEYCESSFIMDDDKDDNSARTAHDGAGTSEGANTFGWNDFHDGFFSNGMFSTTSDHGVFQDTIRQWVRRFQTAIAPQTLTSILITVLIIIALVLLINSGLVLSPAIVAAIVIIVVALIKKKESSTSQATSAQWSHDPAPSPTAPSSKSRLLTLLLCLFGGYCGAHYFYVGRWGMGILYLFTVGFFGFGWLVDIFRIVGGVFPDSKGRRVATW